MSEQSFAPAAEALINADGEVMVVLPGPMPKAVSWEAGPGDWLRIRLQSGGEAGFTLAEEALAAARAKGRVLLATTGEDGRPDAEGWVFRA